MTTPSINNAVNYSFPRTGSPTISLVVPYQPKDNADFVTDNMRARIIREESSSVNGGIAVDFNGGVTMKQSPSLELTRPQMLRHYLTSVRDTGDINAGTALAAWNAWRLLSDSLEKPILVPDAAPGPEGQLLYVWNKGEHHLELEIFPEGPAEFFYLNRVSNETWEEEYIVGNPVSQEAKVHLNVFL